LKEDGDDDEDEGGVDIILEQTILKLVGWDVGTEIETQVTDDSIVLKRHLASGRRSTDRPPEK
jgi:hypothetical protein